MPVTREQAAQLASLAAAMRPHGARRWDEPGIVAAIAKVAHLALSDVAMAVTRAASDRTADNPGVISATTSIHWREKAAERAHQTPPRRDEECPHHPGQRVANCGGCNADRLGGDQPPVRHHAKPAPMPPEYVAAREALAAARRPAETEEAR